MTSLLTVDSLISLITLSLLEIVLGIDNVIFVSILMGRLKEEKKLLSRRIWMFLGITIRILLLLALGWLVTNGNKELFGLDVRGQHYGFNLRNVIMFFFEKRCLLFNKLFSHSHKSVESVLKRKEEKSHLFNILFLLNISFAKNFFMFTKKKEFF